MACEKVPFSFWSHVLGDVGEDETAKEAGFLWMRADRREVLSSISAVWIYRIAMEHFESMAKVTATTITMAAMRAMEHLAENLMSLT